MLNYDYVLITAARNEEAYIEATIKSVLSQTLLPKKWIIVSDGSSDGTDEIVMQYAKQNDFIELIRREGIKRGIDFSSKVHSIYEGYERLKNINKYDFIGVLDGDVSFSPSYYESILTRFNENFNLGIAGGVIFDKYDGRYIRRSSLYIKYVSGCIQLFRRKCYEDIGGLLPIKEGGEDTVAVIMARMKGWEVEAFEELKVFHHKHSKTARGILGESFREGRMFYALGSNPLFEIIKSIKKIIGRPYFLYAFIRMLGYFWPYCKRQKRPVSDEFIRFLRREQLAQLKTVLIKKRR